MAFATASVSTDDKADRIALRVYGTQAGLSNTELFWTAYVSATQQYISIMAETDRRMQEVLLLKTMLKDTEPPSDFGQVRDIQRRVFIYSIRREIEWFEHEVEALVEEHENTFVHELTIVRPAAETYREFAKTDIQAVQFLMVRICVVNVGVY